MSSPHLDDDALSATLDGEATSAELAHVDGCPECQRRVAELRTAANAIGTPMDAVDPRQREAAIAAALASLPTSIASRRRARPPGWLLGAAAAVLAIVALVPLVQRDRSDRNDSANTTMSKAAPDEDAAGSALAAPETGTSGDLGTVAPGQPLRDLVLPALPQPMAFDRSASTTTTAAANGAATAASAAPAPCQTEVSERDPSLTTLRFAGHATVDGVPAEILVFDIGGDPPALRAVAVADGTCAEVRSETFPAP